MPLTAIYDQSEADVRAFLQHHRRTSPIHRRLLINMVLVATVVDGLLTYVRRPDRPLEAVWSAMMTPLVFIGLGVVLLPLFWFMSAKWIVASSIGRGTLGRQEVTITDVDIRSASAHGESVVRWPAVHSVAESEHHFFIYTQPNAAHIIPKASFPTITDGREFIETARANWTRHQGARGEE